VNDGLDDDRGANGGEEEDSVHVCVKTFLHTRFVPRSSKRALRNRLSAYKQTKYKSGKFCDRVFSFS
jgi:hypothetical protein